VSANIDEELHARVKGIVDDLEAAASGSLYDVDGEYVVIDDLDEWKQEQYDRKVDAFKSVYRDYDHEMYGSYDEYVEDECGTVDDIDEPDEVSLYDYVEKESLGDVRFEVDSSKELCGGKTLFCYGGPNIWVADDEVRGYWGSATVEMSLNSETRSAMWGYFEEMWSNIKG
jgi:hypothetical protein